MTDTGTTRPETQAVVASLRFLAEAVDAKDPYTQGHSDRVGRYVMKMAGHLPEGDDPGFRERLLAAALLHDIGKIRIPDRILKKPGRLNAMEFLEIQLHPLHGLAILGRGELYDWIAPVVRSHHEKLNGRGYPDGLRGDQIGFEARMISVADVFDACTSKRVYHKRNGHMSDREAMSILHGDVRRGVLDGRAVDALEKAYLAGEILMVKASLYVDATNSLVAAAGGDRRTPLLIARQTLERAFNPRRNVGLELPIETRFRITVRLATLANLQGESQRAIEYLDVADRLYEGLSISEGRTRAKEPAGRSKKIRSYLHNATLQRVLALRDVGRDVEAREIAVELSARSNDDISAQSNLILAELAMDRGNLEDLDHYLDGARGAVRRMQERLQQDGLRSPLGIGLRWWNPNSVGVLEGRIRLIQVRKSRRIGLARTQGDAQEAAELFESLGRRRETGLARTQLARFLSDAGDFDRAVFTLEKERTYAEEQGDHLSCFRRTCWLAEACYRQGVCLPTSAAALKTQARAMEFLQNLLYARKKRKTYVEHGEEARMVLALAYWHLGRDVGGLSEARKLRSSVARKKREREGLLEAGLVARFLLLVMSRRCNADALLGLAREARAAHLAIREIEFLAEALVVSDGKKMEVTSRLGDLLNRMGGCWLFFHPRYRDRLTALYK